MAGILQQHPSLGLPPGGGDDLGPGKWLCCSGRNLLSHGLLSDSSASSIPGRDSNTVRQCHRRLPVPGPVLRELYEHLLV